MIKKVLIGATLFAAAAPASAVTITFSSGTGVTGNPAPAGYTLINTFETTQEKAALVGSGFSFYNSSVSGEGAQPAGLSDPNTYAAVKANGSATLTFSTLINSLAVYIGSVDTSNLITFNYTMGPAETLSGSALTSNPSGDQTSTQYNGLFTFLATPGKAISSVNFSSSVNSFEIDNISVRAVPEAATWLMMIAGFGLIGYASRRQRTNLTYG